MSASQLPKRGFLTGRNTLMRAFALSSASRHSLAATPVVAGHAPLAARPARPLADALAASSVIGGPAEAARQAALRSIPRGQAAQVLAESPSVS
jgi:hypothetical protein